MENFFSNQVLANHVLGSNPPDADLHITSHLSDFLWMVFAVMTFADLAVIVASFFKRPRNSTFRQLAIVILTTSAIAYFSMAFNLGHTPTRVEFDRNLVGPFTRDICYVRYIQWFINAPLVILLLLLGTGAPLVDAFITLFITDAVVVQGLVGALVSSQYKWSFYVMGLASLFFVFMQAILNAIRATDAAWLSGRTGGGYIFSAGALSALWLIYPLVWALCDGSNVISPTGEVVLYGLLDLVCGPVFIAYLLWSHEEPELPRAAKAAEAGVVAV